METFSILEAFQEEEETPSALSLEGYTPSPEVQEAGFTGYNNRQDPEELEVSTLGLPQPS